MLTHKLDSSMHVSSTNDHLLNVVNKNPLFYLIFDALNRGNFDSIILQVLSLQI